jgi:hypothetical protein
VNLAVNSRYQLMEEGLLAIYSPSSLISIGIASLLEVLAISKLTRHETVNNLVLTMLRRSCRGIVEQRA